MCALPCPVGVDRRALNLDDRSQRSNPVVDVNSFLKTCRDFVTDFAFFERFELQPTSVGSEHHPFQARWKVTLSERSPLSRFIIGFDWERALCHRQSMHLLTWMPSESRGVRLQQVFLYVFTLRGHPNVVHGFWHHQLSLANARLHLALYAGHGPTLRAYRAKFRKLWPIESFRIFDHICAACEYLHTSRLASVVHNALDDQHIVLDGRAVAGGRAEAFLGGPIRLAYFDQVILTSTSEYQMVVEAFHKNLQLLTPSPFTAEAAKFGQTLEHYINMGVSDTSPRNCHCGLGKMLPKLLGKQVMVGEHIQRWITTEIDKTEMETYLHQNGHTVEDFHHDILVYRGSRPPCADPLDQPGAMLKMLPSPTPITVSRWTALKANGRPLESNNREALLAYCHGLFEDLDSFHRVELVKETHCPGAQLFDMDTEWLVYPKAACAYEDGLVAAVDKGLLQESIAAQQSMVLRVVFTLNLMQGSQFNSHMESWFEHIFVQHIERHPNLVHIMFFRRKAFQDFGNVFLILQTCRGVPLEEYRKNHKKMTPIEVFRVLDHICAACEYLHRLRPQGLLHGTPNAKHILLDEAAVAKGAAHAYLDGPIKLAPWDKVVWVEEASLRQAAAITDASLASGVVAAPGEGQVLGKGNGLFEQARCFGRALLGAVTGQYYKVEIVGEKRLLHNYRHCTLPRAFRFVMEALFVRKVIITTKLIDHLTRAMVADDDFIDFLGRNHYTVDDFRSNMLVFRGNNPDVEYM